MPNLVNIDPFNNTKAAFNRCAVSELKDNYQTNLGNLPAISGIYHGTPLAPIQQIPQI
jgi:hypothetical protein